MSAINRTSLTDKTGTHGLARSWGRFWQRPAVERGWFCQALAMLPLLRLGLRVAGYRSVQEALAGLLPAGAQCAWSATQRSATAQAVARTVRSAACHGVIRATCLERSLATWWLLGRTGIATQLRIGVRKEDGRLAAHAWVEYEGVPLAETIDVSERFAPFPTPLPGINAFD